MKTRNITVPLILLLLGLAGCRDEVTPTAAPAAVLPGQAAPATAPERPTATAVPATPTPSEPLAALVNDEPIFLSTYEQELARFEQAQAELGTPLDNEQYRGQVLNALIERVLISQAAFNAGLSVTPAMVDAQMAELRAAAADAANFQAWLDANRWTEAEFREEVAAGMLVEQMVATVTADVPHSAEQVRARYIQVNDATQADSLLAQIRGGADFAALAQQFSQDSFTAPNGGDLGFFARGSLLVPALETAAFALAQPGDVSEVIAVNGSDGLMTYYLVQLVERDPQRPLTADMRSALLQQAFEQWLQALWQGATIVRFVETGS